MLSPAVSRLLARSILLFAGVARYIEEFIEELELNIAQMANMMAMSHSNLYK